MSACPPAACGGGYGARSPERTSQRNVYRLRPWDTPGRFDRARATEAARSDSYFPEWLLERHRRAEKAMISVVATSYLLGVSTRRMEKLVEPLGITRLLKFQGLGDG